ncbi:hypothetical protein E2C01_092247 [Portunus trituberculatus]|uniref:Uncharacterized protein n=1 Tax=Portunus trituberculatus TaxID=210409 RepID=A0A5B7JX91_PORTR|nr:hypothetical protein [Portunus trituberculatus]
MFYVHPCTLNAFQLLLYVSTRRRDPTLYEFITITEIQYPSKLTHLVLLWFMPSDVPSGSSHPRGI